MEIDTYIRVSYDPDDYAFCKVLHDYAPRRIGDLIRAYAYSVDWIRQVTIRVDAIDFVERSGNGRTWVHMRDQTLDVVGDYADFVELLGGAACPE